VGEKWLWVTGLLVVVSLSLADGLLGNVVAYERDTTVFYFPLMTWVAQRLHQGELPLWTAQVFGGYPIFADGEIGLAYPPVLLALLTLPPDRAFVVLRLLHLLLAAIGAFALARCWRLPYSSAALAGVVFALGSFLQAQIHHENIVRTASWIPLMLAFVECALRSEGWRSQLRWTTLAAGALGLAGLSLHSQMLAVDLIILAAYGAFRWAVGPVVPVGGGGRRGLGRLIAVARVCLPVLLCGLGLAAVQLVPLVELAGFSPRGSGIPYSESAAYSLTPYGLAQVIFPYFFRGQGNLQWGLWTHWESYLYIGLVPLVLGSVALIRVRNREVLGWGVMGGFGLILALGQYSPINLHYVLWLLPGLSGLRAPGRFTIVVVLASGMLAAYGLAWLQTARLSSAEARRLHGVVRGWWIALGCIAFVLMGLHAALMTWPDSARTAIRAIYLSLSRDSYTLTDGDVLSGLLWSTDLSNPRVSGALLGLAVVLAVLWRWPRADNFTSRAWPVACVGLAAADLLVFGWAIHPREQLAKLSAESPAVQAVEALPTLDAAPNRVLASPVLNQVAADRLAPFSVQEANGYSSLQFVWHRDYLGRVLYADDALLDLWNVRFVLDPAAYGRLASYKGVSYLPQQALLHAPAGSALAEQRFALAPGAPIDELRFVTALMGAVDVPQGAPVAEVELRDATDQVVGTAELVAGRDAMEWAWDLPTVQPYVKHDRVESAGVILDNGPAPRERELSFADFTFDQPVAAATLLVRAISPAGEFVLYGAAAVRDAGPNRVQQLFGRTKAKYRQVYADKEITVFENTDALARAFLVPRARVAVNLGTALSEMVHQPFQPRQEVILADDATSQATPLATDRGGAGNALITAYDASDVKIHTSASADAWLVLSDTFYPGWTAAVDGQAVTVLRGDVLFRVVPVPAGEHQVEFRFQPASVRLGLLISLGSLVVLVCALGFALAGRSAHIRRTTSQ
jgi:hypothetical protein